MNYQGCIIKELKYVGGRNYSHFKADLSFKSLKDEIVTMCVSHVTMCFSRC